MNAKLAEVHELLREYEEDPEKLLEPLPEEGEKPAAEQSQPQKLELETQPENQPENQPEAQPELQCEISSVTPEPATVAPALEPAEAVVVEEAVEEAVEQLAEQAVEVAEAEVVAEEAARELLALLPEVSAEGALRRRRAAGDLADVAAEAARQAALFRDELQAALLKDIHNMDAPALRARLSSLAAELFERFSWESLRVAAAVKDVERDFAERYEDLMRRQRRELEFEAQRILFEKEKALAAASAEQAAALAERSDEQLRGALRAQAEGFQATLQAELLAQGQRVQQELQDQLNHRVALLQKAHGDHLLALQPRLDALAADLQAFQQVTDETGRSLRDSVTAHAVSGAVLAIEALLTQPATDASRRALAGGVDRLKLLCADDELVGSLLDAVPASVLTEGALTLPELQVRFQVMREEVRKAALAPEHAPPLVGQLVGSLLAAVSFAPKGNVAGPGAEEALARAAFQLERGQLQGCLRELDGVQGYGRVLMADWQRLAADRLLADRLLDALRANAIIRHKSFA